MPIPPGIARLLLGKTMLRAINLDHQAMTEFGKIENVAVNRRLPPKVVPLTIEISEFTPKPDFLRRHGFAQGSCPIPQLCHIPHPPR